MSRYTVIRVTQYMSVYLSISDKVCRPVIEPEQERRSTASDASDVDVPGSNPTSVRLGKWHPLLPTTPHSPTLNLHYQEFSKKRNMDKTWRQHWHYFLFVHFRFVGLSQSKELQSTASDASNVDVPGSNPTSVRPGKNLEPCSALIS